jgi:hypothetical protein
MTSPTLPVWLPDVLFVVSVLIGIAAHLLKH